MGQDRTHLGRQTGRPIGPPLEHEDTVRRRRVRPTGERVVTASEDKTARIWDARTGQPIGPPLQHEAAVYAAAFDATGERVVTASEDKTARIWDARTGQPIGPPLNMSLGLGRGVRRQGRARGHRLFDKTARIWDARTGDRSAAAAP